MRFSLAGAAFVAALLPSAAAAQNLLANPSFEGNFQGWSTFGNAFAVSAQPGFVPRTGNVLAQLFGNFSGGFDVTGIFQAFPAQPGDQFTMDCWSRHNAGDALTGPGAPNANWVVMKIAFFDAGGTEIAGAERTVLDGTSPTDTWIDNQPVNGTAPAGTVSVQALVLFLQPANDGGSAHIDDVEFFATPQIVINEVGYDAPGGDDGQTYVEIYGPAGADVSGYTIVGYEGAGGNAGTPNNQTFTFPAGTVIPNDNVLVVADTDSNGATVVPNADFTDPNFDFENGGDSVVLLDAGSVVVDAVGYGAVTGTNPATSGPAMGQDFFEGMPTFDPFAPLVIARRVSGLDTNDNLTDFDASVGSPGVAQTCTTGIQTTNLTGGAFNRISVSNGEALGFDTWASCAAGGPQVLLLSLTDPTVVAPQPPFPVFDSFTAAILPSLTPPIFNNFVIPALPADGRFLGNQIVLDTASFSSMPPAMGIQVFAATITLIPGSGGTFPASNVVEFTLDV